MVKKKESEFDKLAWLIKSESDDIRNTMATKDDIASIYRVMATKDDIASIYRVMATKDDIAEIRRDMATKDDVRAIVDGAKEEILKIVRPLAKAVDKDAVTIYQNENRIVRIEEKVGLSLKK